MEKAKLFKNGNSQAVRLPKSCRFNGNEILVKKMGDVVYLIPKDNPWNPLFSSLDEFSDDYMTDRKQPEIQSRKETL